MIFWAIFALAFGYLFIVRDVKGIGILLSTFYLNLICLGMALLKVPFYNFKSREMIEEHSYLKLAFICAVNAIIFGAFYFLLKVRKERE